MRLAQVVGHDEIGHVGAGCFGPGIAKDGFGGAIEFLDFSVAVDDEDRVKR